MTQTQLSKTDFLNYLDCSKAFWLKRHQPDAIEWPAPSDFDRMLMVDGYAVEAEVRKLVTLWADRNQCRFQVEFHIDGQLFARSDLVRGLEDDTIDLFEIKASTSVREHIVDACFQRIVAERSGVKTNRSFIIHVNGEYERSGEINPEGLLTIVDVTDQVLEKWAEVEAQIDEALAFLSQTEIDMQGCSCRLIGKARHCASFDWFNPGIPHPSAYLLPRISTARLQRLDDEGRLGIADVSSDDVTPTQLPIWKALHDGAPVIDDAAITEFCDALTWPLHFYDYETFASAIPLADGHRPHLAIPVQFSLHILQQDGTLDHHEYLAETPGAESELAAALQENILPHGSAIVWNQSTEKSCNTRMGKLCPDQAEFLESLNERTVDLMVPFKADYVHPGFQGSTSIKKVLPVLCPDLAYPQEAVHDGTGAMQAWQTMIETWDDLERFRLRQELLEYCKLDTLAMLRIFQVLQARVTG